MLSKNFFFYFISLGVLAFLILNISGFLEFPFDGKLALVSRKEPVCGFVVPAGKTTTSYDVIWSPRVSINPEVLGSNVNLTILRIDGKPAARNQIRFDKYREIKDTNGRTRIEYILFNIIVNSFKDGPHTLAATIRGDFNKKCTAKTSFTVTRGPNPSYSLDSLKINQLPKSEAQDSPQARITPPSGSQSESAPSYNRRAIIPYFISLTVGDMSARRKADFNDQTLVLEIQRIISNAIGYPFGPFSILEIDSPQFAEASLPSSYIGWNSDGIAMLRDQQNNFFGVGVPYYPNPQMPKFRDWAARQKIAYALNAVPAILVDHIFPSEDGTTQIDNGQAILTLGFYDRDFGYIVGMVNRKALLFHNFIHDPRFGFSDDNFFLITSSHETGHSVALGHFFVAGNLMSHGQQAFGGQFTRPQSCLVRRQSHHPELMGMPYGAFPAEVDGVNEFACGNKILEGHATGLNEAGEESYFSTGGLNKHFHIGCDDEDPGIFVEFKATPSGYVQSNDPDWWGSHTTPFKLYSQSYTTSGVAGQCKVEIFCGNGRLETDMGEECETDAHCSSGQKCGDAEKGLFCLCVSEEDECQTNADCSPGQECKRGQCVDKEKEVSCGDRWVDPWEVCDPPESDCIADGKPGKCADNCLSCDPLPPSPSPSPSPSPPPSPSPSPSPPPVCGNGDVEGGEQCDPPGLECRAPIEDVPGIPGICNSICQCIAQPPWRPPRRPPSSPSPSPSPSPRPSPQPE